MNDATVIFVLLVILVYAWIGYPLALLAFAAHKRVVSGGGRVEAPVFTSVTVLLAAHNEEDVILQRLENLVRQESVVSCQLSVVRQETGDRVFHSSTVPFFHRSILLGLDACTDRTAEIARQFAVSHPNVHVFEFPERRGKAAVIKSMVTELQSGRVTGGLGGRDTWSDGGGRTEELRPIPPATLPHHSTPTPGPSDTVTRPPCNSATLQPCNSHSDILIFTDANTRFAVDALERLIAHFDRPDVGGVCGRLVFVGDEGKAEVGALNPGHEETALPGVEVSSGKAGAPSSQSPRESVYWEWETRLKTAESTLDSCLGANGAIYAIRASLFPRGLPANVVVDDFVIGMKVREQGFRMLYEPAAVAYEEAAPGIGAEWIRRVRIGAGDFQSLFLCWRCLLPWYGWFAWIFWSHKVLRWFTPHLLMLLVAASIAGVLGAEGGWWSRVLSVAVVSTIGIFLCMAAVGRVKRAWQGRLSGVFRLCYYFLAMQAALFAGFLRFCTGGLSGQWTRTARGKNIA